MTKTSQRVQSRIAYKLKDVRPNGQNDMRSFIQLDADTILQSAYGAVQLTAL